MSRRLSTFCTRITKDCSILELKAEKGESAQLVISVHERTAADELKYCLVEPIALVLLRVNGQYTVDTGVSDLELGCVLLQEQEDRVLKPIDYCSRSMCDGERCHDKTQKEFLIVVWSVSMLRLCLERFYFRIRTDHKALRCILDLKIG